MIRVGASSAPGRRHLQGEARTFLLALIGSAALAVLGCSSSGDTTPAGGAGVNSHAGNANGGSSAGGNVASGGTSTSAAGSSSSGGSGLGNGGAPAQGGNPSASGGAQTSAGGSTNGGSNSTAGAPAAYGGKSAGGAGNAAGSSGSSAGGNSGGNAGSGNSAGSTSAGSGNSAGGSTTGDPPLVYPTENTGADCPAPAAPPAFSALIPVSNLPDPFLMTNGTRITTRDQWRCRRAEISSQIQYWGSGPKGTPPSNLTATYSGGKLSVVVTQGSASITLSATLTTPSGDGPFPLVIGMNTPTGSLPASIFNGVATLTFTSSQLVPDAFNVTRGAGTYFSMYPDKNAGAMIEWAWGVSRLIDGLYKTKDQNKIDLNRIAVTGCSFQGKMALYAGAFDERIALTIPEESGGGGEASWRFMATQTGTEDLEAAQGTAWYAQNLKQFKNADASKLPYDQHELVAMIAPRAVLVVGNTGIDRLGSQAGYVSMKAASEVYKALGVPDRIGYTQAAASGHCVFPSSQTADVTAFVSKFLLAKTGTSTAIAKSPYTTDMSKWITWTTPSLK